ncbi:transcriptional regulator [Neiella marina]|uniref:Transcriptional regulator n=1 Tax=Neiella marina TaxID=508461 RepID=A0A8J2U604_9GAMM|nr:helix-turn-helix transcriptional regulator [Neiella marina]GGA80657.1 transcriptional regulator [Neiella marina]
MGCMELKDRFKQRREELGLTQRELGMRAGTSQVSVLKIERGQTTRPRSLLEFAQVLQVSPNWLLYGDEEANAANADFAGHISAWDKATPVDQSEVEVPFYEEVELSAGTGRTVDIHPRGKKLRFAKQALKDHGVDPDAAACVTVKGNSMEPVLPNGATVGIDTACTEIRDGDMYAIDWHGELYVKTLTRRPGGALRIRSFNRDEYPDDDLGQENAKHVRVIGRVFWYSVLV